MSERLRAVATLGGRFGGTSRALKRQSLRAVRDLSELCASHALPPILIQIV